MYFTNNYQVVCKIYVMIKVPCALQLGSTWQLINVTGLMVKRIK